MPTNEPEGFRDFKEQLREVLKDIDESLASAERRGFESGTERAAEQLLVVLIDYGVRPESRKKIADSIRKIPYAPAHEETGLHNRKRDSD